MRWPTHYFVGHAERIHNIEREKRDMRRLEHVAAGVEDEIRPLARLWRRPFCKRIGDVLAEPGEFVVVELHAREHIDAVGDQTEILDARLAPLARLGSSCCAMRNARHRQ